MKKIFVCCSLVFVLAACGGGACSEHESNAHKPVFFEHNSTTMLGDSMKTLDDGLVYMTGHRFKKIELDGYADETGVDENYNMGLSQRRVEAVRDYMVKNGVANDRIKMNWHGTERGRPYKQHRRVDITIK